MEQTFFLKTTHCCKSETCISSEEIPILIGGVGGRQAHRNQTTKPKTAGFLLFCKTFEVFSLPHFVTGEFID